MGQLHANSSPVPGGDNENSTNQLKGLGNKRLRGGGGRVKQ